MRTMMTVVAVVQVHVCECTTMMMMMMMMTATTTLPEAACHPSTHAKHVMLDAPGCEGESTKTGRAKEGKVRDRGRVNGVLAM